MVTKTKRTSRHYRLVAAGLFTTVVLIVVACFVIFHSHQKRTGEPSNVPVSAVINSIAKPSASKSAADYYAWKGFATNPKRLVMPSIGVSAFIQDMGVDTAGNIAAPTNIFLAGWYIKSAQPGDAGLSIIDGHINGLSSGSLFDQLDTIKIGDVFSVIRGDNTKLTYKVISNQTVPDGQALGVLFSQDPKVKSQLNLITCAGIYDKNAQRYDSRTIVAAALQN